ncbi:RNA polymerase recycling motor HelD [Eubacterium multiforme]|uniref:DNA helicase-2/ATP-dependent DNA helicase PcrA n=1 Tax=Eubacterium multiforme TaxID=83339 RepID=A0ABT9UPC2_9FIRM|nr:RNA polymerase recycling motor HelD [Eubacterium multiforme]MDQ0148478.1 DNA helicase-2/ATP-dependent DNA helicase PcrA [Eubacterium multiforme]
MSNSELNEERLILEEKRKLIDEELLEKQKYVEQVTHKFTELSKELKGKYNFEKESIEKAMNLAKNDIQKYEEVYNSPYFGRVDFREKRSAEIENIYIGKHGINSSKNGEEVVVDWRAPVADLYYSGTGGEAYYKAPVGIIDGELSLKRKFLFDEEGILERIFDESINELMINGEEGQGLVDEFLKINLEESRGKKLKEVVATIQKEQNDIIRWPRNLPIIVQGSAGSGKTTIALHRLAYLIYRYKENMSGEDILVLAPNKLFLDYISEILPSLGANEVKQSTFEEMAKSKAKIKGKIYNKDEKLKSIMEEEDELKRKLIINSAKIRGSLTFKIMIDRYITLIEGRALEIKDIEIENQVLFKRKEIMRLYLKDLRAYPINKRKDEIKRYLTLKLKEKIQLVLEKVNIEWDSKIRDIKLNEEDSEDRRKKLINLYDERDKIKKSIKNNSKTVMNDYFKAWRGINPSDIYRGFYNDDELFEISTDGKIPEALAEFMKDEFNRRDKEGIVDEDDLAALLYIRVLLEGIEDNEKFKHIVVDEAQDYSPFQIYLVNEMAKGNSLTLVGDLAQGIYYYKGLKTWEDITKGLFKDKATFISLTQSYRSTVEIIDFAKGALDAQNLGLKDAKPVLRHGAKPEIINLKEEKEVIQTVENIIDKVISSGKNSIALITKDSKEAEKLEKLLRRKCKYKFQRIKGKEKEAKGDNIIIPSYLTKGLEFDCSIIYNPSKEDYKEESILDQRLLYVSLTRALHTEYIIALDKITSLIKN